LGNEPEHASRWPARVVELFEGWRAGATPRERDRIRGELWLLVNAALARYVRLHGRTYGFIDTDEARDVASEKAMVFLRALENATPDASALDPARVCAYLSVLARNGLVDILRKRGRDRAFALANGDTSTAVATPHESAEIHVQHDEFLTATSACVMQLTEKARNVWFMRAFLDLPSKRIAAHPEIRMTPTAVNMLLVRARRALRDCLSKKGFDSGDVAPGTFVVLWDLLRRGRAEEREDE
jgi:DNA-directed RNA polymerase specialized sigma24 family protein